jgi:hypothetical protein
MTFPRGYVHRVAALAAVAELTPGAVAHVEVIHEAGCPALEGGRCHCRPEVELTRERERWRMDADGLIRVEALN